MPKSSHLNFEAISDKIALTWTTQHVAIVPDGELRLQTSFDGGTRVLLYRPTGNDQILKGTGGQASGLEGLKNCVDFFNDYLTVIGL